jgi:hypothetical protein
MLACPNPLFKTLLLRRLSGQLALAQFCQKGLAEFAIPNSENLALRLIAGETPLVGKFGLLQNNHNHLP